MDFWELFRPPMIADDAGQPVRRFSPVRETFTLDLRSEGWAGGRSGDTEITEIADRLNKHSGRSILGWVVPGAVAALFVGILSYWLCNAAAMLIVGNSLWGKIEGIVTILSVAAGILTLLVCFVAVDRRRDREASRVIERTLREEGRCLACAGRIGESIDERGLHACDRCGARWKHSGADATARREQAERSGIGSPSTEMLTVVDVTGRVFRVADLEAIADRPEFRRMLGLEQDRTHWLIVLFAAHMLACLGIAVWVWFGWVSRIGSLLKYALYAYLIYVVYGIAMDLRGHLRQTNKKLVARPHAGTLLMHEFCPACLATLEVGDDARETRSCPSCGGQWPGPEEMTRFGFPAMTPGTCMVCRYDLSSLRAGPGGLVVCPECGARARLPKA